MCLLQEQLFSRQQDLLVGRHGSIDDRVDDHTERTDRISGASNLCLHC